MSEEVADCESAADLLAAGLDLGPVSDVHSYVEDPYPDYDSTTSRVISGPIGPNAKFSGTRYTTWREAAESTRQRFHVIKFWTLGLRWFARVRTFPASYAG